MAAKPDKAARTAAKRAKRAASKQKRKQIFEAFNMQRREDKLLIPLMLGSVLVGGGVAFAVGLIWGMQWLFLPVGIAIGVLLAFIIFGRRLQSTMYGRADGEPGAAAWALDNMRGAWRVTPGIAGTTHLDAVHRVIGLPGIVLVAEGAPHRVKSLLAQEKKRTSRVVGAVPIYDVTVGNGEGQVELSKLHNYMRKLPRNIDRKQIDSLETRLAALGSRTAALPKGPLPAGAKMRSVQRTVRRR